MDKEEAKIRTQYHILLKPSENSVSFCTLLYMIQVHRYSTEIFEL